MNLKGKHLYIEGLRGLLALVVITHHFVLLFNPTLYLGSNEINDYISNPNSLKLLIANTPLNLFMNGDWAVCMFFLLSGYVLSLKYYDTNNLKYLQQAFFKRYFRLIIPILSISIIIYLLFRVGVFQKTNYPRNIQEFSFGRDLFINDLSFPSMLKMALLDVPLYGNNTYLPVFWTMEVEFLGVLVLFTYLMFSHDLKYKNSMLLTLVFCLIYINKYYLVLILLGSLIANSKKLIELLNSKKTISILILGIGLYLSGIPNLSDEGKKHTWYWFTVGFSPNIYIYTHIISCVLVFIFILSSNFIQKILSLSFMVFLGKISFSIYLIHLPILFVIGTAILSATQGQINPFLLYFCLIIISIAFGFGFYKFIDKPSINFTESFIKRLFEKLE